MSGGPYGRRGLRCQKCKTQIALRIAKLPVSLNIILNPNQKLIRFRDLFVFFSGKSRILKVRIFDKEGLPLAEFDITAAKLMTIRNG